jgi:hypothetical protein
VYYLKVSCLFVCLFALIETTNVNEGGSTRERERERGRRVVTDTTFNEGKRIFFQL